jgi:hypothetical protein
MPGLATQVAMLGLSCCTEKARFVMTQYRGIRDSRGETRVTVNDNGATSTLPHIAHHSSTGMDWGYEGSGPADLARSLLAHHVGCGIVPGPDIYQTFKLLVVAKLPPQGWMLDDREIEAVLTSILKAQSIACVLCSDQGVLWPEQLARQDGGGPYEFCSCSAGQALVSALPAAEKS